MLETFLKAKIHKAVVTEADLEYEGSIAIGKNLLEASGIRPYEQVHIANFTNGRRWWTYAIEGEDGTIGLNGGSARMGMVGDVIAIFSYVQVGPEESHCPRVVLLKDVNQVDVVLSC
jgi:aspartate 1-decarboxylase